MDFEQKHSFFEKKTAPSLSRERPSKIPNQPTQEPAHAGEA
jgi:hypothetical protein